MSIPNFKNKEDYQEFLNLFDDRLQVKVELLNRVKEELFPNTRWIVLPIKTIETINDITQSLLYDVEFDFEEKHPDYKRDDELFIPRRSFKEDVTEALKDAMPCALEKHNQEVLAKLECPPCDVLQCVDHLTDD